jgi:hypothetical protein
MLLHLLVKREVGQFYIARRASSKECSLLQPYIVTDNNQEHSNEEFVMYSSLWRKVAVGSNLNQQKRKEVD